MILLSLCGEMQMVVPKGKEGVLKFEYWEAVQNG